MSDGESDTAIHHPEDKRPRMDVDVVETDISASAEAKTGPVAGKDGPYRKGQIAVRFEVTIECPCGEFPTAYSNQSTMTCHGCGRQWKVRR